MPNMQPGDLVVLISVPPALFSGLPEEDQMAIRDVIGKPVRFSGITYGQAEIEFKDDRGDDHTIWVDVDLIKPA